MVNFSNLALHKTCKLTAQDENHYLGLSFGQALGLSFGQALGLSFGQAFEQAIIMMY